MAITPILALTAAEFRNISGIPEKIVWMACHFSPYGPGLSNLPKMLPHGALLMVDDVTPLHRHDAGLIAKQLARCVEELQCSGVLLDFQRKDSPETAALAKHLAQALPCPVAVSEAYARDLDCPVFLPPVPPSVPLEAYIVPWRDRDIWLELGLEGELLELTEQGCAIASLPCPDWDGEGFADGHLHCHYTIETNEKAARFTLWRTRNDLEDFLQEAESLGIRNCVGLYQEIGPLLGASP